MGVTPLPLELGIGTRGPGIGAGTIIPVPLLECKIVEYLTTSQLELKEYSCTRSLAGYTKCVSS